MYLSELHPKWDWFRIVEEMPEHVDVKLKIRDPRTNRLTELFINTLIEGYKLPISPELLRAIFQNAKRYAGLECTSIRINKAAYKNILVIRDIINIHTAKLKKFCMYIDSNIMAHLNEKCLYNWVWTEAIFNRETEKFEPIKQEDEVDETAYSDMASFFEETMGEYDD